MDQSRLVKSIFCLTWAPHATKQMNSHVVDLWALGKISFLPPQELEEISVLWRNLNLMEHGFNITYDVPLDPFRNTGEQDLAKLACSMKFHDTAQSKDDSELV